MNQKDFEKLFLFLSPHTIGRITTELADFEYEMFLAANSALPFSFSHWTRDEFSQYLDGVKIALSGLGEPK